MTWSVGYADGSANLYRFRGDGSGATFDYEPVTPERSSTGTYWGGPPRTGRLDAATLASLWQHVRMLEADVALHVEDRMKGTGAFTVTDAAGTRSFVIKRGPELAAFDAFLGALGT